jgi:hypothetical protein
MKRILLIFLFVVSAQASRVHTYKVHYDVHGLGRDIIVQAETSSAARSTVENLFPQGFVTNVREIR